ncbi:MAG: transporter [Gammaproteobacteria bacterium]|nr:transporter [Gammaproteobacteria bacterium]
MESQEFRNGFSRNPVFALLLISCVLATENARGQDVEPRRWTPFPDGTNILGTAYARTSGDVLFDPVLLVEDAQADVDTLIVAYARSFAFAGRLSRLDVIVPWQNANWSGLLEGAPASVSRVGLADPSFRVSVNLFGAPAASGNESQTYVANQDVSTLVGVAIAVTVPLGEYLDDKLLNLGSNRYIIRPQVGVVHTRGAWSYELTGSTFFFTDNKKFLISSMREQDPLYAVQAHLIRVFRPGLWSSLSAAYGWGGENTVDGVPGRDKSRVVLAAISAGFPVAKAQGVSVSYIVNRTHEDTGSNLNTLTIGWSLLF